MVQNHNLKERMLRMLASGISREERDFIMGAGMSVDLFPTAERLPSVCSSDYEAFHADWSAVSGDMWVALARFLSENQQKALTNDGKAGPQRPESNEYASNESAAGSRVRSRDHR